MHLKKRLLIMVVVIALASFLTVNVFSATVMTQSDLKFDPNKYKGKEITVWQWWPEGTTSDIKELPTPKQARENFEKLTGAKVKIVYVTWNDYQSKLIPTIMAGKGADIIWGGDDYKPTWMYKKLLMPLDKYINFKDKKFMASVTWDKLVLDTMTWKNQHYAVGSAGLLRNRLYYNKEMFELNGLEDPLELYKKGKWTWQKFWQLGQELTQDTNGDGKIDVWGYISWWRDQWLTSNGVEIVKYVGGKPKLILDSPKAVRAFQAASDTINKYKIEPTVWWDPDPQQQFLNGKSAMDYWGDWDMASFRDKMGKKLGVVPFPKGPDLVGKKAADTANLTVQMMASSCKYPELAGWYLMYNGLRNRADEDSLWEKYYEGLYGGKAIYNVIKDASKYQSTYPTAGLGSDVSNLINNIWNSSNPAKEIKAQAPKIQAALDKLFK
ncbi:ABC transporter substrate-binding protein [Caldicellulosiruptoraceae bacterium PP1]